MENYIVRALSTDTWDAFEQLVEKHSGVWGGCWCTWFHAKPPDYERGAEANRCLKKKLVEEGNAHAALVFDGDSCIAWCQFGSPQELPNIYHKREIEANMAMPDWRITCIFVDKNYRLFRPDYAVLSGNTHGNKPLSLKLSKLPKP